MGCVAERLRVSFPLTAGFYVLIAVFNCLPSLQSSSNKKSRQSVYTGSVAAIAAVINLDYFVMEYFEHESTQKRKSQNFACGPVSSWATAYLSGWQINNRGQQTARGNMIELRSIGGEVVRLRPVVVPKAV
jgi:hypothetical protein